MNAAKNAIAIALGTLGTLGTLSLGAVYSTGALAQSTPQFIERDIHQQQRIEQGLRSGQLTVQEAAGLERETARIDRLQARALSDGRLSPEEAARINRAQDRLSQDIRRETHDAQTGNPNSPSSQRMQADVQRNINQDRRIAQGLQSGQLNNRDVSQLERSQAQIHRSEARAGADGHIGRYEQQGIRQAENSGSRGIYRETHDTQQRADTLHTLHTLHNSQQASNDQANQYGGARNSPNDGQQRGGSHDNGQHKGWTQGGGQSSAVHTAWSRGTGNTHRR